MRTLTEELGRLVYKVECETIPTSNTRRGTHVAVRRQVQSSGPDTIDPNSLVIPRPKRTSSDEDETDSNEQNTPLQQPPNRTSMIDRRPPRFRTNSDDSATQSNTSSINTSSLSNRVS